MNNISLRIDGVWLRSIAAWGELSWAHAADGGCKDASWRMDLPATFNHPSLRRNKLVEVMCGPMPVWQGVLTEPDYDDDWTFTAQGLSALGADYYCFDSAGNTTSTPDVAITQAIADGLPWTMPTSISSVPFGSSDTTTTDLNTLTELLNAYAASVGQRWGVNSDGQVYCVADPTDPMWYLAAGAGRFGLADDNYASHLYGRYLTTANTYATAVASDLVAAGLWGRKEYAVDLTNLGPISSTTANNYLAGLLANGKARMGYTNGLGVNAYQLTNTGRTPASFPFVKAGQLVRMFGVLDEQGQPLPYLDWVIGETSYDDGADIIGLTPVGLVDRELSDVFSVPEAS